jgi:hypothetical protein
MWQQDAFARKHPTKRYSQKACNRHRIRSDVKCIGVRKSGRLREVRRLSAVFSWASAGTTARESHRQIPRWLRSFRYWRKVSCVKIRTCRASGGICAGSRPQPMILVFVLAPLIFFPISSTIRRSIFPERNAGNQGACNRKCSLFLGHNLAWQAGANLCNLMNFVFNECQSEKDLAACQHPFGHRANPRFETVFPKPLMRFTCAASFAHARLRSSSEVRFPSPREIPMRLTPIHHQNCIGIKRIAVDEDSENLRPIF